MEALILALKVFCMVWICWRMFKLGKISDETSDASPDLGFLTYRSDEHR